MRKVIEPSTEGAIPIGIVDMRYNRLSGITPDGPRREDPCIEKAVFTASALKARTYRGSVVTFITGSEWYFTGETNGRILPALIEIDLGDGSGFRSARFGEKVTAGYPSPGTRTCRLRALMPDGEIKHASFMFDVAALETPLPHDTIHVTAAIPYEGGYASGSAYVYLADSLASLSNPLVVLEGFDIDNTMFWDELYADLNQEELVERARAGGYDIVVLDFDDSTDFIQRNSFVVVELLSQLQAMIPPSRDIALVGASMGGLCGRYALSWMEQNGPQHRVRTYISFDAPHGGANIPLGVQYWVKFFSEQSASAEEMLAGLESPAARQMLEYHFTDPPGTTGESDPLRDALTGEFAALGEYPSSPRKVAVANGSGHAEGQGFSAGEQIILYEYSSFLVDIIGNVWAVPDGPDQIVFDGLIDILLLPEDRMIVHCQDTRPLDNAPGGSRPSMAQMDSTEAPYGDIMALHESHCFIPTVSALDIDTEDIFYDVAGDPSIMDRTPFDTIIWAPVNERHIFISPECADFLLAEISVGITGEEPLLPRAGRAVLLQNRPNPFNPVTTIRFALPAAGHVTLRVYDPAGRLVRTLIDGRLEGGWREIAWNGRDDTGRSVASGVYFCRLATDRSTSAVKMILLR
jgi:hypothetical protein